MKTWLLSATYVPGGIVPACICSLVGGSDSENSQGFRFDDSVGLPVEFPSTSRPLILPHSTSIIVPDLPVMVGCWASASVSSHYWG